MNMRMWSTKVYFSFIKLLQSRRWPEKYNSDERADDCYHHKSGPSEQLPLSLRGSDFVFSHAAKTRYDSVLHVPRPIRRIARVVWVGCIHCQPLGDKTFSVAAGYFIIQLFVPHELYVKTRDWIRTNNDQSRSQVPKTCAIPLGDSSILIWVVGAAPTPRASKARMLL